MKITRLTPEQETELPRFRQRYLDIACGGGRIDRPALEAALADAYAVIGKPAPKLVIYDSPAACMLALDTLNISEKAKLWGPLWDQFSDQLRDQLWDQLEEELGYYLRDQFEDQLGRPLWGQLRDKLESQLGEQNIFKHPRLMGSQDLCWIAWADFAEWIGVEFNPETAKCLDIMRRISTQSEWWWPYGPDEDLVVASERPTGVHFDDKRRLHCETGPAAEYADGYALYSWHGVSIPKQWVTEPSSLTAKVALSEEDIEHRRAACEILGWATILDELDARIIDQHDNPEIGELIEVELPDIGKERFLKVHSATGRTFAIPVPPEMTTALEANAWAYGSDEPGGISAEGEGLISQSTPEQEAAIGSDEPERVSAGGEGLITQFTPEQEAAIPIFRQRYLDIACGGERIDREALEEALADAYALIGKPAPRLLVFDSPPACMMAAKLLEPSKKSPIRVQLWPLLDSKFHTQLVYQVSKQFDNQLFSQLSGHIDAKIRRRIDSQLEIQLSSVFWGHYEPHKAHLWAQIDDQICERFEKQLGDQFRSQFKDQLGDQLESRIGDWINEGYFMGIGSLYWIAYARFCQHVGVRYDPDSARRLDIMERISIQCQSWWPLDNVVVACQRPVAMRWDGKDQLHCADGPAVEYADGFNLYSWHGAGVPKEWIVGDKPTPQEALTWEDIEQRRAACKMLGWENILSELKVRTIDQHDNPEIGELIQATLPGIGRQRFLKVRCPTGRTFILLVSPKMTSAFQANAWTYGFDNPDEYQLEVRT